MSETEFALSPDVFYLNHAAVSPWPQRTVRAVERFARENGTVGSRHYDAWLATESALREQFRTLINADSADEIALLKNTSEALSVVAWGMPWQAGDEVIVGNEEFPSNRIVWESLAPLGVKLVEAQLHPIHSAEDNIIAAMTDRTRLVSVSSVQYGSGLALHLDKLGQACRQRGIALCVDAIQSLGVLPFDVQRCQADFVMADGHKWMLGPEGIALFYCRRRWLERLQLRQYGWHMVEALYDFAERDWRVADSARRFECGSPNMLGVHALHASLQLILETGVERIQAAVSAKVSCLIERLQQKLEILTPLDPGRRAGIVTFRSVGGDQETKYRELQENGVVCALRGGGIRFSPHFYTPESVLDRALQIALR